MIATNFDWVHGRKAVIRRTRHAGLSLSWFEIPLSANAEYVAILEDDMEVSSSFYMAFNYFHRSGSFAQTQTTAFCLHPGDWEVDVPKSCRREYSPFLYESPEPCNWGPIWKVSEWRKYADWVMLLKAQKKLPLVPNDISYNYNKYLDEGKDVQSSWVWRYNYEVGKRQIRYSFTICGNWASMRLEPYLAINHKEPGEHFMAKLNLQNDPSLLTFDYQEFLQLLEQQGSAIPQPFHDYPKGKKSMHG